MKNEVKLIDMNTLWKCETCFYKGPNGCKTWCDAGEGYRPAASKLEIIDLESLRPKGRWIKEENGVIVCSECGEEHEWEDYRATYCEDCGAKMEG